MIQPQVSVLLPVYNGARYVEESIRSILDQDGVSLELIVVDDASTDDTRAIVSRLARTDPRVTLIELPSNGGASGALNAGLAVAKGTYVARQDADDVSLPGRLAAQVAFLDREPDVVLLGANYVHIDAGGEIVAKADHARSSAVLAFLLNFTNSLGVPGQGMFRTDVAREVGGFSSEFRLAQGYELWTRLATRGRVAVLPMTALKYRIHGGNVSRTQAGAQMATAAEVSRRMLSRATAREISRDDSAAVYRFWRGMPRRRDVPVAAALIAEIYAGFLRADPIEEDRSVARTIVARRFARAAMSRATSGDVVEAIKCSWCAFRWHPSGVRGIIAAAIRKWARVPRRGDV